ncbi:hypothetical protein Patl1_29850 [Pistacia atlantica]|uniref:Uncharacterized protein n=1 Tax=Pistacia atlantica TaxID=434234 RepID=A0ACC1AC93_9ROSI|nr:hypothetical protein Patl1_29850 [Pistacia atlantica]
MKRVERSVIIANWCIHEDPALRPTKKNVTQMMEVAIEVSIPPAIGASLSAAENSSSGLSLSGDFAFGFHPIGNNNELFLPSIWYDKIPSKTILWFANRDKPGPRGSRVELTSASGLATLRFSTAVRIRYGRTSGVLRTPCCLHRHWNVGSCLF